MFFSFASVSTSIQISLLLMSAIPYLYLLVSNILINFIPIVKGDGYYALASLRNKFHFKKTAKAAFLEDLVRGVIMFAVLDFLAMFYSGK